MIHIKRPPAPEFLLEDDGIWKKETAKAIAHYAAGEAKAFEFKAYNDVRLKDELKRVFVKCAYCESNYGAVSDGDVEHFRPKGKISEKNPQTPGYYWLANDWDNLLLSCQHCNQRRKHQLEPGAALEALGKLDQFPLSREELRAVNHLSALDAEDPVRLLINPCRDEPREHFNYEIDEGVMVPLTEQGKRSVDVYALRRPLLVQERKKQLILLLAQMDRVKRELKRFNEDNSPGQKAEFKKELGYLMAFTAANAAYAGMCRFFVRTFLQENGINRDG